MKYLGIDWGEAKVGLATATSEVRIATPHRIIGNDVEEIKRIIASEEIDEIVVGYPLMLSGEAGIGARKVDEFIKQLEVIGKPVHRQDERFTTRGATAIAGRAVARGEDDSSAAALILQIYLDKTR